MSALINKNQSSQCEILNYLVGDLVGLATEAQQSSTVIRQSITFLQLLRVIGLLPIYWVWVLNDMFITIAVLAEVFKDSVI